MSEKLKNAGDLTATPACERKKPILSAVCLFLCAVCFLVMGVLCLPEVIGDLVLATQEVIDKVYDHSIAWFILGMWDFFVLLVKPLAAAGFVLSGIFLLQKKPGVPFVILSSITAFLVLLAVDPVGGLLLQRLLGKFLDLSWHDTVGLVTPLFGGSFLLLFCFLSFAVLVLLSLSEKGAKGISFMRGFVITVVLFVTAILCADLFGTLLSEILSSVWSDVLGPILCGVPTAPTSVLLAEFTERVLWSVERLCLASSYLLWFVAVCGFCASLGGKKKKAEALSAPSCAQEQEETV